MPFARRGDNRRRHLMQFEPPHQATAACFFHSCTSVSERGEALTKQFPLLANAGEKIGIGDGADDVERNGRDERSAAERRRVIAGREGRRDGIAHEDGTHREATGERLRERVHVGHHARVLRREQGARAAEAALHLVKDQCGACFGAARSQEG